MNRNGKNPKLSSDDFTDVCGDLDFTASEAYKMLRTSIQYSFSESDGCKVIGITGTETNEGKSTLAINLAYMLSCDKQKVLLLEGDMRLPSISKKLRLAPAPGLSDYLTGRAKNNDGIQHSEKAPALSVICSGIVPPNPSELLGSESMDRLIKALKARYDYVIVDLPPVNFVSDPLSMAKYIDGYVIVVRSEFTTRKGVREAVKKLQMVNAKILGFALNDSASSRESRYGRYKNDICGDKYYEKSYERSKRRKDIRYTSYASYNTDTKNQIN